MANWDSLADMTDSGRVGVKGQWVGQTTASAPHTAKKQLIFDICRENHTPVREAPSAAICT